MERVRTPNVQNNLTTELNRLARTNQKALHDRIMELLQSTDPATIMQFEAAERDSKLNLLIIGIIADCRNELRTRVLLEYTQCPTRQGVQNLMNAAKALKLSDRDLSDDEESAQPNDLAAQLYRLFEQRGTDGVTTLVRTIVSRPGADMRNFRESTALSAAVRHFRDEAERDPSSKAAAILKIIETNIANI